MNHQLPSPLPLSDRLLLQVLEKAVPCGEREEWRRTWQAELWHMHHRRQANHMPAAGISMDLTVGLTRDALWLRTDSWRRTFNGTATLCLASLVSLILFAALLALALNGSWHLFAVYVTSLVNRCLCGAPIIVFVSFAISSRSRTQRSSTGKTQYWIKRQLFVASKTSLVLLASFLLSADMCQPLHARFPNTSDICQLLTFVLLALAGQRWVFGDQDQRCKQCLRALATPARVGRPSHNLLEWSGTELICRHGHGLLSVPEMESSWCESSHWVYQTPCWDRTPGL